MNFQWICFLIYNFFVFERMIVDLNNGCLFYTMERTKYGLYIGFYTTLMCSNLVPNPRKTQEKMLVFWGEKHI